MFLIHHFHCRAIKIIDKTHRLGEHVSAYMFSRCLQAVKSGVRKS
jgi:hypothetical protein